MKNIAIIPARSGSKGLEDKNIRPLNGKPLMAYSIEAAMKSGQFDTVMVSTDSAEYANVAEIYGADVPFYRSKECSGDTESSWNVVKEVIGEYKKRGETYDTFCLLQPTSPLRKADDIVKAYQMYKELDAFFIVSMTELEHPIQWCGIISEELELEGFVSRDGIAQRQSQSLYYRPNGAIYIANITEFLEDSFLYRKGGYAYIMPKRRSVDIDDLDDFNYAEFLMKGECF